MRTAHAAVAEAVVGTAVAMMLSLAIATPSALAAGCDLDELIGYQLVAKKSVEGYLDDAGREQPGYFGCVAGRVLVFTDRTGVRCRSSGRQQGLMPPAYLFARSRDELKLCVLDELYDVAPAR